MPGLLRQGRQRRVDAAHALPRFQYLMRRGGRGGILLGQHAIGEGAPGLLGAQVVDGGIAGATVEIGGIAALAHRRALPQPQENILHEVAGRRGAADAAADLPAKPVALGDIEAGDVLVSCCHLDEGVVFRRWIKLMSRRCIEDAFPAGKSRLNAG